MAKYIDIAGQTFGNWTALEPTWRQGKYRRNRVWICQCACGVKKEVGSYQLRHGKSRSCGGVGCSDYRKHQRKSRRRRASHHPLYNTWYCMRRRCCCVNDPNYHNYGGRGIRVCDRWSANFWLFVKDMGERPAGYTLDRIDVNQGYSPDNCRWADAYTQSANRRPRSQWIFKPKKKSRTKSDSIRSRRPPQRNDERLSA